VFYKMVSLAFCFITSSIIFLVSTMDTLLLLKELLLLALSYYIIRYIVCLLLDGKARKLPPGPRGYPVVGALPLLGGAPHVTLARLAKRYGPIMHLKMGRDSMVVASTAAAARTFLKTLDANFANRPLDIAPKLVAYGGEDMVFADYGPKWKLLRKTCSLGMLGPAALERWANLRISEVGHMLHMMYESSCKNEPVDIAGLLSSSMVNMIGQVVLSRRILQPGQPEAASFKDMVVELMTVVGLVNFGDYIPGIAWMDLQGLQKKLKTLWARFDVLFREMVELHEATAADRKGNPDVLDDLISRRTFPDGEKITDDNIKALLLNLFSAGSDTSSSAIEWTIAELLLNPSIAKRAQAEMDQVIGRNRRLMESDIPNLPYLQAICKEGFRKHPSTPLNLPRICTKDCEADGYYIPKGTRLIVNIWAIGRDPDVWENPDEFNPDRFMTENGSKIQPNGTHFELIPFGAGRRICAGARMGQLMVEYILGTLIHAFDWRLPEGVEPNMDEVFGIAIQKAVPLTILGTPRLPSDVYA
jgi:flavonoid 3',5'-hydroxylase